MAENSVSSDQNMVTPEVSDVVGSEEMPRNVGREQWERNRIEWNTPTVTVGAGRSSRYKAKPIRSRQLYDTLKKADDTPFQRRVPLNQLVEVLVELWSSEGIE